MPRVSVGRSGPAAPWARVALLAAALVAAVFVAPVFVGHSDGVSLQPQSPERGLRVMMRARLNRYPKRSRKNSNSGGRPAFNVKRHKMHSYSMAPEGGKEPSASIVRRLFDNYERDYSRMMAMKQARFTGHKKTWKWRRSFYYQLWQKQTKSKRERKAEEEWLKYMNTVGRGLGLQEPVKYMGPRFNLTEDAETATRIDYYQEGGILPISAMMKYKKLTAPRAKWLEEGNDGTEEMEHNMEEWKEKGWTRYGKHMAYLHRKRTRLDHPRLVHTPWEIYATKDMEPGKWVEGEFAIHNIIERPLARFPYDIPSGRGYIWHGPCTNGNITEIPNFETEEA